ncbi:MAG: SDR family oxidoreductase [Thermoflexales bacterium]|nr:SDR family oxidoreductase [Thermoflexales bacterium]
MTTNTIFITGAGKGLGFSLAKQFLGQGWRVFAGVYPAEANLHSLTDPSSRQLTVVPLDVTDRTSVRQAAETVAQHTPALDVLINNAGVYMEDESKTLEALELDIRLQATMDVNAFGPLRVTQQFLPLLRQGQRKRIVNISSEAGSITDCWRKGVYAYCMSKAALNMQSMLLHNDLGPQGFTVLAIHPGWMRTDMGGASADIHPDESAQGIFRLATQEWGAGSPIYMDYTGKPMRW